jgi:hypothetical protein
MPILPLILGFVPLAAAGPPFIAGAGAQASEAEPDRSDAHPIIDHKAGRERALKAYANVRAG